MYYEIYEGDTLINTIVGSEAWVSAYCEANGYSYIAKEYHSDLEHDPKPITSVDERVTDLEAENKLLAAKIEAQSDQLDFYEECIAEMASIVYA